MHFSLLFHSSYLSNLVSAFKISLSCTCQPTVSLNKTFPETAPHDFGYILLGRTGPVAVPNNGVWTGEYFRFATSMVEEAREKRIGNG